jgi:[ribosomal protein S5]-alanine N-acetyltransferase
MNEAERSGMAGVTTPRMRLTAGTRVLAKAELEDAPRLSALLEAEVPPSWPPESLEHARRLFFRRCEQTGIWGPWNLGWYGVLRANGRATLCASVGFKGPPSPAGMVEIGYSVLPDFQRQGIATEVVIAMSRWALDQPAVRAVEAEVLYGNVASLRVLANAGFSALGPGLERGTRRFRRVATETRNRDGETEAG